MEILDFIFVKVYVKEEIDGLVMPKVCLNMNLVKQFIEMGGFEKIENCKRGVLSKQRDEFVIRYSAACFDPDDLSLNTEFSSSCNDSEQEFVSGGPLLQIDQNRR